MSDRTVEIILKLTTRQFAGQASAAQQAVQQLGAAMAAAVQRGVNPLNIRLAAATAGTKVYHAALQQGVSATQASAQAAQAAALAVQGLGQRQQHTTQQSTDLITRMGQLRQAALLVVDVVQTAARALDGFINVGERAAGRERTARMFGTLSGDAAEAAENLLAVQKATLGTLSETEAMEQAITLLGLRLAETPDELGQITQQVAILGRQFSGFSADRSIQQFALAVGNLSPQRLSEFGIGADEVTRRMEALEKQGYATEEAFKLATLQALAEQFERIGGAVEDSKTPFEQYHKEVEDLQAILEAGFLPTATKVVIALRDIARELNGSGRPDFLGMAQEATESATTLEDYRARMVAVNASISEYNAQIAELKRTDPARWLLTKPQPAPEFLIADAGWAMEEQRRAGEAAAAAQTRAAQEAEAAYSKQLEARKNLYLATNDLAQRQAESEIAWGRRAEDEALEALRRQEDQARRTAQQRAQIAAQYARAITQAERQYQQAVERAAQQHGQRRVELERQYQQRIQEIQRQYTQSVFEATLNRDAVALFRAKQQRDEQLLQAQEQREEQRQQNEQQYAEQLEQARQALDELRQAAAEAQAQALADLQENLRRELEEQAIADRRRREDQAIARRREQEDLLVALAAKMRSIYGTNAVERAAMNQHYTYLLGLAGMYYSRIRAITAYRPSLPAPTPQTPRARASGGYAGTGLYTLGERGREFVLNAETTRRLEGQLGGSLTQQNVVNRGLTVNATFAGMGGNDRAWFEARLQDFGRELARMVEAA